MHAVAHHKDKTQPEVLEHQHQYEGKHRHNHHNEFTMVYSDEIEDLIDVLSERLEEKYGGLTNLRWHALKILEQDQDVLEKYPVETEDILKKNYEKEIINQKYDFIEEIIDEVLVNKSKKEASTDRIDEFLTHPIWGAPIFLGIMVLVFLLTFTVGDAISEIFNRYLGMFSGGVLSLLEAFHANEMIISLVIDGIIAGVGGILTFLPNIFILFLALAILEDSGYMSRVAYVMDTIMGRMGLSGRAFIPMLLGFGCTVPAIMASRTLENRKDKLRTMLVTPFMSCSARLPIYVLFSKMFFGKFALVAAVSMYIIGLIVAILVALILGKIDRHEKNCLLIELPEYKRPNARSIINYVWEKVKDYLVKAGTTIFVASIIIWFIMNFGQNGITNDISKTFAASIGRLLVPVMAPIGLGFWQIVLALISGIAAKEVVVSSCSVIFAITNINSLEGMGQFSKALAQIGFGTANALSLMVFSLLYVPCVATLATIKKESNSWKFTGFAILLQVIVAWVMAFLAYRIGLALL